MLPCQNCNEQVPIPRDSDPECALVYKAGESEDGVPMSVEEIRLRLVSGELSETDLIWNDSTWRPLGNVLGGVQNGEGPRLKTQQEEAGEAGEKELAESFDELSPIQKVDLEDQGSRRRGKRRRKRRKPGKKAAKPSGKTSGEVQSGEEIKRPRGKTYYVMQVILAILAVALGYKYGFGPLLSRYRHKPSYILVHNHENAQYLTSLGIRGRFGLGGPRKEVFANSMDGFELYVGLPEKRTLTMKPSGDGSGEPYSVKVPLRPGSITLVNAKGKGSYGAYDMTAVSGQRLNSAELKKLGREIASNSAPETAIRVSRQIRDLVGKAFLSVENDEIFRNSQYRFSPPLLQSIQDKVAENREKAGEDAPEPEDPSKPMLYHPPSANVSFANGAGVYRASEGTAVDRQIVLPVSAFNLNRNRILKAGSPRVNITGNDKVIRLNMTLGNAQVSAENKTFNGSWTYRATCPLEGANRNKWTWNWQFSGRANRHGVIFTLNLKVNANGRESSNIERI